MAKETIILGMDAAISGGSVSLVVNNEEVASWTGSKNISRAEELLPSIDHVLSTGSIKVSQLTGIIVSVGPGSFTGIKIGISTALGLRTANNVSFKAISIFQAIRSGSNHEDLGIAIPVGRGYVAMQTFAPGHRQSPPQLKSITEFGNDLNNVTVPVFVHMSLIDDMNVANHPFIENIGENMAVQIARAFATPFATERIEPLYLDRIGAK